MRAVVLRELSGPEGLRFEENVPDPVAGPGEAVVRIHAAALNRRDVWILKGQYAGIKLPVILGSDGAGIVESVGPDTDASLVGKGVVIYPGLNWGPDPKAQQKSFQVLGLPTDGTFAQLVKVPATHLFPVPEGLSWEEAATLPLAGVTAYRGLVTRARLKAGESLLVTGIGGGVAAFGLQIGLKLGARVFVTSGDEDKLNRAKELGASGGVSYRSDAWWKEVHKLNGGTGVDVVLDSTGGAAFTQAIEAVKPGGRIVNYGATAGPVPELALTRVFWRQIEILGSSMGTIEEFGEMLKLFGPGGIRPVIDTVFPLSEAPAAHRRMEEAGQFGKIVLSVI